MTKDEIILNPIKITKVFQNSRIIPDNLDKIKARKIWNKSNQGCGIVVAVLDSGIQMNHPNLRENIIDGYNFTEDDNGNTKVFNDYYGHGTHVSGIIAAIDNGIGIVGVAPKSKLLVLKVIDKQGKGNFKQLTKAIKFAADWKGPAGETVSIINMSLGGSTPDEELHKAIKYARSKGIVLVAAAGNEGDGNDTTTEISYPGFYKEVIQIGSISAEQTPSKFSNTNVNLDFVGPGENILSTHLDSKYVELSGTSMAAPFISGAAALIINIVNCSNPNLIPYYVYDYFLQHSKK
ncbi:S8 family peptidase, partial [Priestia megaterium]|uniref:S8 family peptidase n=1 Tax=Priestia megaterium TaxID=1404 RepID=UPI003CF69E1F